MWPRGPALLHMQCPRDLRKLIIGWFTDADLYMAMLAHGMQNCAEWYSGMCARKCIELYTETKCPRVWMWQHGSSEQINYMLEANMSTTITTTSQYIHATLRLGRIDLVQDWWSNRLRPDDLIPAIRSGSVATVWFVLQHVWGHSSACSTQKCNACADKYYNEISAWYHAWNEVVASDNIQCAEILATVRTHCTEHCMFNLLLNRVTASSNLAQWFLKRIPLTQWARGHLIQRDPAFADLLQKIPI